MIHANLKPRNIRIVIQEDYEQDDDRSNKNGQVLPKTKEYKPQPQSQPPPDHHQQMKQPSSKPHQNDSKGEYN